MRLTRESGLESNPNRRRTRAAGNDATRRAVSRVGWSPWQESNLHLALRRHLFYPLNYREMTKITG